jgi:phage baseplate assembly protein W
MTPTDIAWPFGFDAAGRTARAGQEEHVKQMLGQLIFTNLGERVNRPEFGSGLMQLVFAPNSPELATALQFNMRAAIQRWLGDLIELSALEVASNDATIGISLRYVIRATGAAQTAQFTQAAP